MEKNRTRYSKDVQSYNNSIVGLDKAKYDYKIAKAEQKGKMDKASKLKAKRDLNIKKIKARASISNAYIKDTYDEVVYDKLNKVASLKGKDFKLRISESASGFQSLIPVM